MNDVRPAITQEKIKAFLETHFAAPVETLTVIKPGHFAQVYGFHVRGMAYVIRVVSSTKTTSFTKEEFIFAQLLSSQIPAPPNLNIGRMDELYFAISHRIPGAPLDTLPQAEHDAVLPQLIERLDAIHQTDITQHQGYGHFDDTGGGRFASWHVYLADIREEEPEEFFYGKWHTLFDETFLDNKLFYRIYEQMVGTLSSCPEERHLLHGDYGFDNILVENGVITGIPDWSQAQYGDPLYEVARLDFWSPSTDYRTRFWAYYQDHDRQMPAYEERLRCYQCHAALDALRFFAKQGDRGAYDWIQNRVVELQL